MDNRKVIYLDDAIDALTDYFSFINPIAFVDILSALPPAEPEIAKEYDLKKNIQHICEDSTSPLCVSTIKTKSYNCDAV